MPDDGAPIGPTSLAEAFRLDDFVRSLAQDLADLRAGKISVREANARAVLAKQVLRGVHYVVTARRFLEDNARQIEGKS